MDKNTNLENKSSGAYPLEHDGEYIYVITEHCLEEYYSGDKTEYPNWTDIREPAFKSFENASKYLSALMETRRLGGDVVVLYQKNEQVYKSEVTHVTREESGFEWVTKVCYRILQLPLME